MWSVAVSEKKRSIEVDIHFIHQLIIRGKASSLVLFFFLVLSCLQMTSISISLYSIGWLILSSHNSPLFDARWGNLWFFSCVHVSPCRRNKWEVLCASGGGGNKTNAKSPVSRQISEPINGYTKSERSVLCVWEIG